MHATSRAFGYEALVVIYKCVHMYVYVFVCILLAAKFKCKLFYHLIKNLVTQ